MIHSVADAGRLGGRARARSLSPERRREIARQGWVGRSAKRFHGLSKRECVGQIVKRIRERGEPVLATFVASALRRDEVIAAGLVDLLNEHAFLVLEAALIDVLGELPQLGRGQS